LRPPHALSRRPHAPRQAGACWRPRWARLALLPPGTVTPTTHSHAQTKHTHTHTHTHNTLSLWLHKTRSAPAHALHPCTNASRPCVDAPPHHARTADTGVSALLSVFSSVSSFFSVEGGASFARL
jgi:hypothetical protein